MRHREGMPHAVAHSPETRINGPMRWLAWRVAPAGGVRGGGVAGLGLFAFLCQIHMAARKLGETFSIQSCGCLAVLDIPKKSSYLTRASDTTITP